MRADTPQMPAQQIPLSQAFATTRSSRLIFVLGIILGLATLIRIHLASGLGAGDDAYITLKIARNIADGNGFVYNLGERVLVTSTPLYALVIGVLAHLSGASVLDVASNVNFSLDIFNLVLISCIAYRSFRNPWIGAFSGLLAAASKESVISSSILMESSLCCSALLVATWFLTVRGNMAEMLCGFVGALAALIRPEAHAFSEARVLTIRCFALREVLAFL